MTGLALLEGWAPHWLILLVVPLWVGHACIWTTTLNNLYARPIPKRFLRLYRVFCGVIILGFPLLLWAFLVTTPPALYLLGGYLLICLLFGGLIFPVISWRRYHRAVPPVVESQTTEIIDYWEQLGPGVAGDGRWAWTTRLPGTCSFQLDFTHLRIRLERLPPAWNGLRILLLSDLHFHGTPSRDFFETLLERLRQRPEPDLLILAGDILDTDHHHEWIVPLLGNLPAREGKFAILGNHDDHHNPEQIREELRRAGFTVLGNNWVERTIRGEACVLVGHEGPWFRGEADFSQAPAEAFRLLISHTPDNFPWAQRHGIPLMLSGHVHGGQIRLPLIGSIFVPSIYGRRYDEGVFLENGTVLVVSRGISGREPIRFRCHPQVIEIELVGHPANG